MAVDNTIKLPEKLYCGFNQREHDDDLPLGFMVPWGTDAAFNKRKATVDNWAKGQWWGQSQKPLDAVTFENELLTGFRIGRSIKRHGWNGGNVVVRIEDPRGFELEISVANLTALMETVTIDKGEIQGKCIWGRSGAHNLLLSETSQPYLDAVENTERLKRSVSLRDVKIGYKVRLQNGIEGQYLGKLFEITNYYSKISVDDKAKYTILNDNNKLEFFGSIKVADIMSDAVVMTQEEAAEYANRHCKKCRTIGVLVKKSYVRTILKPITIDFQLIDTAEDNDLPDEIYMKTSDGLWKIGTYAIKKRNNGNTPKAYKVTFSNGHVDYIREQKPHPANPYYGRSYGYYDAQVTAEFPTFTNVEEWYVIDYEIA